MNEFDSEILDWVKKNVNLIKGTIDNTQLINDGYDFLILGTYFERADFTARIINVKYLKAMNILKQDMVIVKKNLNKMLLKKH